MTTTTHRTVAAAAMLAALLASPHAGAEGFDARPITVQTRDGLASVVVSNPGDSKIYLETQIDDWTQDASGHDTLAESDAAIASPPALWVGPHSTYNLRVRLPDGAPGQERAFRLLIKQIPVRSDIVAGHIVFALTQSLPAFNEPADLAPPSLRGRLVDNRHLLVINEGGRRARLSDIRQDGQVVSTGLAGYALGHSAVAVLLPTAIHPGTIEVATDVGPRTIEIR